MAVVRKHRSLIVGLANREFRPRMAVGMLIAEHPPHRSGRAQFEHPAPTSGV